ncbi:MAG: hypothetical protein GOMPHAMPRED_005346 [Gomphillus americanus]|uniref:GH16 domain-containing protein n=1 Tax=Gomphillus americanus TaxID=1940652 RepID=A0A8H3FTY0_9LECA|nr:MAG: hypothetical protein GOMPHAMPRED_005346 [Gomphillus americanus]
MYLPLFFLVTSLGSALGTPLAPRAAKSTSSTSYKLNTIYTSANFFSSFTFFSDPDPTSGHVVYQTRDKASQLSLAGMLPDIDQQPIYLATEHSQPAPDGRPSIRVQSTASWTHGLFVFDIAHMPTGCGTWPALWLLGSGAAWPTYGEIDIVEGVNDQIGNSMTMHTSAGCAVSNSSTLFTGSLATPNCDVNAANQGKNAGCSIADTNPASFGPAFNKNGGGVYAVQWTSEAVTIWFFPPRSTSKTAIPSDLQSALASTSAQSSKLLNPSSWPTPQARFAGKGCDLDTHVKNQSIIINTSLCGDWAGATWEQSSCAKKASTCDEFVTANPTAFKDAFWAIRSIQVWQIGS